MRWFSRLRNTHLAERRDADVSLRVDAGLRNVRYAVRSLLRTPGFTTAVVLTLGLGIGANTAVFSALDTVLLRPLPYPEPDRLVRLSQTQEGTTESNIAPARLEDWNRLSSTFSAITGYYIEDVSETSGDFPERLRRAFVAPRFLDVWGVYPVAGAGFSSIPSGGTEPSGVLISDRYWRRRFGGDPNLSGKSVRIGATTYPVAGVMPASFLFPDRDVDLWFQVRLAPALQQARNTTWYIGIGRLAPGVTPEQARANLATVQAQLAATYPDTDRTIGVQLQRLKDVTVGGVRSSLWLLFGAVSVLLLITCTNIAALMLSRASHRRQEHAVRLSLGATRGALAAQVLTEAGVLAAVGCLVGLAFAAAASAAYRVAAVDLPRIDAVALDARILGYMVLLTVSVTLLCGLLPAVRASRGDAAGASRDVGRVQVSSRASVQWILVGAQVALSVTLLAGAGLLVRSFYALSQVEPGFERQNILSFRVSGSWAETVEYARLQQRIESALDALRSLPGVEASASALFLPGVPAQFESTFALTEARSEADARIVAEHRVVSTDYFTALRIPLVAGEWCRSSAFRDATNLMVNRTFAERYLAGRSAIGLHLATADGSPGRIAGIVGDARERGLDREPGPVVYNCFSTPNATPYFLVRTRNAPELTAQLVRARMKELEPRRAVYDMALLDHRIDGAFAQNRLRTLLIGFFAATAIALAGLGLYGTLSYVVSLRRREVGLRMALGATRGAIVRQFLLQGVRLAGIACACGLALALFTTRLLSTMLFGVAPNDPATLSVVIGGVLGVSAVASLIPAVRAARVDPMRVLRSE